MQTIPPLGTNGSVASIGFQKLDLVAGSIVEIHQLRSLRMIICALRDFVRFSDACSALAVAVVMQASEKPAHEEKKTDASMRGLRRSVLTP